MTDELLGDITPFFETQPQETRSRIWNARLCLLLILLIGFAFGMTYQYVNCQKKECDWWLVGMIISWLISVVPIFLF